MIILVVVFAASDMFVVLCVVVCVDMFCLSMMLWLLLFVCCFICCCGCCCFFVLFCFFREADRVILTTCQQEGANQSTFQAISTLLGNKTPSEVTGCSNYCWGCDWPIHCSVSVTFPCIFRYLAGFEI